MYMRRSMGEDTLDMGPGAKICIAAANGSTVGRAISFEESFEMGSGVGEAGGSVGEGISSGVDVGDAVGDSVSVGKRIVAVGIAAITESGEGDICSTIQGGGGTCVCGVPQPDMAATIPINTKTKVMRPIYFPARRFGLRAVRV
jgi:hypothetical protein